MNVDTGPPISPFAEGQSTQVSANRIERAGGNGFFLGSVLTYPSEVLSLYAVPVQPLAGPFDWQDGIDEHHDGL